jgi:hypothetical protein
VLPVPLGPGPAHPPGQGQFLPELQELVEVDEATDVVLVAFTEDLLVDP